MDPKLKVLTHTSKRVQEEDMDDGLEVGRQSSPKRKKLLEDKADPEGMEEQAFTPRSIENLQKIFGNAKTLVEDPGAEAATGRGNNHHSRGKSVDRGAKKGSRFPKHRRGVVAEARVEKPLPKRRQGSQIFCLWRIYIEVTPRDSKKRMNVRRAAMKRTHRAIAQRQMDLRTVSRAVRARLTREVLHPQNSQGRKCGLEEVARNLLQNKSVFPR